MQRSSWKEGASEMQSRRHHWRPEETYCSTDRNALGENCIEEVVHYL